jgi:hypothetical protein
MMTGKQRLIVGHLLICNFLLTVTQEMGERGGAMVEALRYKPEGRGFDSRLCHYSFSLT